MTPVPMDMQYPHLGEVKNKSQRPIGLAYCIDPDAPDREKKEFEEQMLKENAYFLKDIYGIEDPYYTWKGEIIDRATGQPAKELDLHNEDADDRHGVGVIVIQNGLVLVGTRVGNGMIGGPGGHVEEGETDETAAYRETIEEFGIFPGNLIKIDDPDGGEGVEGKPTIFLCTKFVGKPKCDGEEMWEPRWMSIQGILDDGDVFEPFAYGLEVLLKNMKSTLGGWRADRAKRRKFDPEKGFWFTSNGAHIHVIDGEVVEGGPPEWRGKKLHKALRETHQSRAGYKLTGKTANLSPRNVGKISPKDIDSVMKIGDKYYVMARDVAGNPQFTDLHTYLDHSETHIQEVLDKSLEALDSIERSIGGDFGMYEANGKKEPYYGNIDERLVAVAALLHDTGMNGDDRMDLYKNSTGFALRKEHALCSAMNVLKDRAAIEALGVDPDELALIVYAHSKSGSGKDEEKTKEYRDVGVYYGLIGEDEDRPFSLSSNKGWTNALRGIQSGTDYANRRWMTEEDREKARTMAPVREPLTKLDKKNVEKGKAFVLSEESVSNIDANGETKFDMNKFADTSKMEDGKYDFKGHDRMRNVRTAAAALRLGDAAREGGKSMLAQDGGMILVDRQSYKPAKTWEEEAKHANVHIMTPDGEYKKMGTGKLDTGEKPFSRAYAVGESNFGSITFDKNEKTGNLRETITITDGNSFPLCTMMCINDRVGEFESLGRIPREMVVKVAGNVPKDVKKQWDEQVQHWRHSIKCDIRVHFEG